MKKLLVTLVAVSFIAGAAVAEEHKGKKRGDDKMHGGEHHSKFIKSLPQEKQDKIKEILQKNSNKEEFKALADERKKLLDAEKFDKAAFIKNAEKMKALRDKMKEQKIVKEAEILAILSPEERKAMLKDLGKKKDGKKPSKGKDGKKNPKKDEK